MILYYMDGCGHCAHNQPAWEDAKKKMKGKAEIKEIESANAPTIKSFPTMVFIADGKEESISGAKDSGDQILKELKIRNEGGSRGSRGSRVRRRNTRGRATRGRNRKIRHRTLRNNIAFV